jgi:hypothetical protein
VPAYLVRIIDTRDLVGIFVADDEDYLAIAVDECTDAPGCEYVALSRHAGEGEVPVVSVEQSSEVTE